MQGGYGFVHLRGVFWSADRPSRLVWVREGRARALVYAGRMAVVSRDFNVGAAANARPQRAAEGATRETSATSQKNAQSSPQVVPSLAKTAALPRLVDAGELAAYLGVDRGWVYAHADELGARRLGSGPRARLRFSVAEVDQRLTACYEGRESRLPDPAPQAGPRPRRRRRMGTIVELLPIRGRESEARP